MKRIIIAIIIICTLLFFQLFGVGIHTLYKNQKFNGMFFYDSTPRPYLDIAKQKVVLHKVIYVGVNFHFGFPLWGGSEHYISNWFTLFDKEITVSENCKIYYREKQFNMADHYYTISCLVEEDFEYCANEIACRMPFNISVIPNDPNVILYGDYHSVERWVEGGIVLPTKENPIKDLTP